jgi:hypothetical protein
MKTYFSLEDFYAQNDDKMISRIQEIIRQTLPDAEEKLMFHTPFFLLHGWLCYLRVTAHRCRRRIGVGFVRGTSMAPHPQLSGDAKNSRTFWIEPNFDENLFKMMLTEAANINFRYENETTRNCNTHRKRKEMINEWL